MAKLQLSLTKKELTHLRDLMGVRMSTLNEDNVSGMIAKMTESPESEQKLWNKVAKLCETAGIVVGEDAPDYHLAVTPFELTMIKLDPMDT